MVQLNAAPAVPLKEILTGAPAHTSRLAGVVVVGVVLIVRVTAVRVALTQPVAGSIASAKKV